jgi:hypothetical protein
MVRLQSRPKWGIAPLCRRLNAQVRQALETGRRHMMENGGVSMRANMPSKPERHILRYNL